MGFRQTRGVKRGIILFQPSFHLKVSSHERDNSRRHAISQLKGKRNIAIVMNAATFSPATDIEYFITNVSSFWA